ncbi:SURF1 family protein [Nocardioides sp. SOB77]|uniref:SURF1-like protein n=1 Tax=Nocardioides oceani TaxID=3058369 RepID=A0ABT8FC22_9ACTN|nr:SURF1 family protein [Nocardioides oceani]MDN4172246.1 SURF1 family protein [Nocardioides oceani]
MPAALSPRYWGGHLLAVVLVALAGRLGVWQLESWQAHREAEVADFSDVRPVPLLDVIGPDDPFPAAMVGRPVEVGGTWIPGGTVYVEGREHDGQAGYWAVTPLEVEGGEGSALYVVRGWTPSPEEAPVPAAEPVRLAAYFQPTEGSNATDPDRTDDVLPQVRTADLVQHVDQDLFSGFGVAREPLDGLAPAEIDQVSEASAFTGLKNFLYGIEWFVFGAFAAFIWWRWSRELGRAPAREPEDTEQPVPSRS